MRGNPLSQTLRRFLPHLRRFFYAPTSIATAEFAMPREILPDLDFKWRPIRILGTLLVLDTVAFYFLWTHFSEFDRVFYVSTAAFVVITSVGLTLQHLIFTRYRCSRCRTLMYRTAESRAPGQNLVFYCPNCDVEWDTGFSQSSA